MKRKPTAHLKEQNVTSTFKSPLCFLQFRCPLHVINPDFVLTTSLLFSFQFFYLCTYHNSNFACLESTVNGNILYVFFYILFFSISIIIMRLAHVEPVAIVLPFSLFLAISCLSLSLLPSLPFVHVDLLNSFHMADTVLGSVERHSSK